MDPCDIKKYEHLEPRIFLKYVSWINLRNMPYIFEFTFQSNNVVMVTRDHLFFVLLLKTTFEYLCFLITIVCISIVHHGSKEMDETSMSIKKCCCF